MYPHNSSSERKRISVMPPTSPMTSGTGEVEGGAAGLTVSDEEQ